MTFFYTHVDIYYYSTINLTFIFFIKSPFTLVWYIFWQNFWLIFSCNHFFFLGGGGGRLKFQSSVVTIVGLTKVFNRNVYLDLEYISWKFYYLPNSELDISFSRFYLPMKIAHKDDSCYKIPTQATWLSLQKNWIKR